MDMQAFWQGVERIADEFNIGKHPLAQLVSEGKASKRQITQFAFDAALASLRTTRQAGRLA